MDTSELKDCWAVSLKGHEFDLREWVDHFRAPHDPVVLKMPDGTTLLFSHKFEGCSTSSRIKEVADQLIPVLNGIMSVTAQSRPLEFDGVSQFDETGRRLQHKFISVGTAEIRFGGRATLTSGATVAHIGEDGLPVSPPPPAPTAAQQLLARADVSPQVAKMLDQLSKSNDWGDVFKVFEHAEGIGGGQRNMKAHFKDRGSSYERARSTANFHRHANAYCPDPPTPLREAQSLAREAVTLALGRV